MTTQNNASSETHSGNASSDSAADAVRRAFAALPLDQKLSTLFCVELDMLGDAAKTVLDAASRVADEIVNAFTEPIAEPSEGGGANGGVKL